MTRFVFVSDMIARFHLSIGQRFGDGGSGIPSRKKMHEQEHQELVEALDSGVLADIAQELADVVYVAYGTAYSLGIPLDLVLAEVHRANMRKIAPNGPTLKDGKVQKPSGWQPPDVAGVMQTFVNESC